MARLQVLVGENRAGAKAALYMKQNIEASLATVQLAVTLLAAIAAAIGGAGAAVSLAPWFENGLHLSHTLAHILAIAAVVVPLTMFTILFGELVPKVFSLRNKEWVCLRLSPLMQWFSLAVLPAVWLFETSVRTLLAWSERQWRPRIHPAGKAEAVELLELRAQAASARASRLIGEREEGIILGAARLSSRTVREIMLPAEGIGMLDVNQSLADNLVVAHLDMHTRFPVAERSGDPRSIIGYVTFKDLVALMRLSRPHEASLRAVLRPLVSFQADLKLTTCLERMIREHTHIALVRDATDKLVGMITLEDILEELVGDIQDEYDRLPVHVTAAGWAWVVGGGIGLPKLKEISGIDLAAVPPEQAPPEGVRNASDWIIAQMRGKFRSGDIFERGGLRVVIRKIRRQKVLEAQIGRVDDVPAQALPEPKPQGA
jgi:putative hemolysin